MDSGLADTAIVWRAVLIRFRTHRLLRISVFLPNRARANPKSVSHDLYTIFVAYSRVDTKSAMTLSRCRNSMIAAVLLVSSLLLGFVQAGGTEDKAVTDLKLGNQTIERVSIGSLLFGFLGGWWQHNNRFPGLFFLLIVLGLKAFFFSDITTSDAFNICTVYRPGLAKSVRYSYNLFVILISTDHFIRWWDFGADAYIVRSSVYSRYPNSYHFRSY